MKENLFLTTFLLSTFVVVLSFSLFESVPSILFLSTDLLDMGMFLKRGNVLVNTGWQIAGSLARMVVQLIIGAFSARYLGPSNYGILNYVAAYISLFSIICELGLTLTIVNEIIKHKDEDGVYVGSAIFMRIVASLVSMAALLIISSIVDGNDSVIRGVVFIRSLGLLFDSFNTINFWYQSKLQSKFTTLFELIAYIVSSIYKVCILAFRKDIFWFAAATTVDSFLIAMFLFWGFKKQSGFKFGIDKAVCKDLLKSGVPFILSGIMVYVYGQADRIMIGKMMTQTDVGYYSCAATIGTLIAFLPQAIMNSSKTVIIEQHGINYKKFELCMRQTLAIILWIMNVYALILFVFGRIAILVLYGNDYMPALPTLKVLIWSYGLSYVGTLRNIWLICEGKRKYATIFSVIGATLNIILNYFMIAQWGIVGAAIATVITQGVTTFVAPFIFKDTRRFSVLLIEGLCLRNIELKKHLLQNKLVKAKIEKAVKK